MTRYLVLTIVVLATAGFLLGRAAAWRFPSARGPAGEAGRRSAPGYHGAYVAIWVGVPALLLVLCWLVLRDRMIDLLVLRTLPEAMTEGLSRARADLLLGEVRAVAAGYATIDAGPEIRAAAEQLERLSMLARLGMFVVTLAAMLAGAHLARGRLSPRFPARRRVEQALSGFMILCALLAIATTFGLVVSLLSEAWMFFRLVPPRDFFFGLNWEPQIAIRAGQVAGQGAFGAVPVFLGTLLVAGIAMAVAVPVGLLSAIYLVEYAGPGFRGIARPLLEILSGIPTVVYGFFAILVLAPRIQAAGGLIGVATAPNPALAAGLAMGVMIVPFICAAADDALSAVPAALRDASLALGATSAETMTRVLLPAAMPGIAGGILLGLGRAIGETMIVLMAGGVIATLSLNPLGATTTVTAQIVTLLIGDTAFDSPKTLAAFALGLTLFLATLALNLIAMRLAGRPRAWME